MILASHGIVASQIQSFVGLLDAYPNAAAAYSLRKLRTLYTGSAIQVRRSSDNTTQDIGFTGANVLDTTALTSFCSGTNGFVTTWYDQSGNGRDATQSTAARQPQIVSSGSVINLNTKPAMQFDGSNDGLNTPSLTLSNNSYFSVYKQNLETVTSNFGYVFADVGISQNLSLFDNNTAPNQNKRYVYNNPNVLYDGVSTNAQELMAQFYPTASPYLNLYINGAAQTFSSLPSSAISVGGQQLSLMYLNSSGGVHFTNGNMQEFISYNSNQLSNLTGIQTNINSYYAIY
jgi:hypothetical protein